MPWTRLHPVPAGDPTGFHGCHRGTWHYRPPRIADLEIGTATLTLTLTITAVPV